MIPEQVGGREVPVRSSQRDQHRAGPEADGDHPRRRSDQWQRALRHQGGQRPVPEFIGLAGCRGCLLDPAGLHQHGKPVGNGHDRHAGPADSHRLQGQRRGRPRVRGWLYRNGDRGDSRGPRRDRVRRSSKAVRRSTSMATARSSASLSRRSARHSRSRTLTPVPYRTIVDIVKCNNCHQELTLHGNSRTGNAELCATCHNPNATDINRRVAGSNCEVVTGTLDDQSIDLKYMIHAIHAAQLQGLRFRQHGLRLQLRGVSRQAQQLRRLPPARYLLPAEFRDGHCDDDRRRA